MFTGDLVQVLSLKRALCLLQLVQNERTLRRLSVSVCAFRSNVIKLYNWCCWHQYCIEQPSCKAWSPSNGKHELRLTFFLLFFDFCDLVHRQFCLRNSAYARLFLDAYTNCLREPTRMRKYHTFCLRKHYTSSTLISKKSCSLGVQERFACFSHQNFLSRTTLIPLWIGWLG